MPLKRKDGPSTPDAKKAKKVAFADLVEGIEANKCIKVFLVSRPEEVDAADSLCIDGVDLNPFFSDGKINGYIGLKINVWLSVVSFSSYADITFQSKLSGSKDSTTTDLKSILQNIFGASLVEQKDDFLQRFATEIHYIRDAVSRGEVVKSLKGHGNGSNCQSEEESSNTEYQVIRMNLNSMAAGLLYSRLVPLILLLVEGGSPVDINDPKWEIYVIVERIINDALEDNVKLLGFSAVYHFYYYPSCSRLRISQVLILPPYQRRGHGRCLLETVNSVAMSDDDVYDVTVEEPSDYFQYLRTCIDAVRLSAFNPFKPAIDSVTSLLKEGNLSVEGSPSNYDLPANVIGDARKALKINKKQLLRCWEVLVYLNLNSKDPHFIKQYRTWISDRMKASILDKDVGSARKHSVDVPTSSDSGRSFSMFTSESTGKDDSLNLDNEEDPNSREELLSQLVDEKMKEIQATADKISTYCKL